MLPWNNFGFHLLRLLQLRGFRYGLRLLFRIAFGPRIIRRIHRWAGYGRAAAHQAERSYRQSIAAELNELLRLPSGLPGDGKRG